MRRIWWMSCWIASSCSSFSMRATRAAVSVMLSSHCRWRRKSSELLRKHHQRGLNKYCTPSAREQTMTTILTTHVGSLPHGAMNWCRCSWRETTANPMTTPNSIQRFRRRSNDAVAKQVEAGVSVVSNGELGKVGYSTYVTGAPVRLRRQRHRASRRSILRRCRSCARSSPRSWATRSSCGRVAWRP